MVYDAKGASALPMFGIPKLLTPLGAERLHNCEVA
jgi:hypothetical protein